MAWTKEELDRIYQRTRGRCHLCGKTVARSNHGRAGRRGSWEVDHSRSRRRGGGDHPNNLRAACLFCNRSKGGGTNGRVRRKHGRTRAPRSPAEFERAKRDAGMSWGLRSMVAAGVLGMTPGGVLLSGAVGGALAYSNDPED